MSFSDGIENGYGIANAGKIARLDTAPGAPGDLKGYIASRFPDLAPASTTAAEIPLEAVTLLPPIPNPDKVLCVATNFHEAGKPVPEFPLTFIRTAEAQTGHGCPILKPDVSDKFDFEGELAVIIGKRGHKIARSDAMSYVAGYACFNDGSARDWQKHSTQFTPGKNFYRSGGFGPWMVSSREVPDPTKLALTTRVNGETRQSVTFDRMIFDIPYLISYMSTFTPLVPGDVIVTGTPSGFGATSSPPIFLSPGDEVEVEIAGIGILCNRIASDSESIFS